VVSLFAVTHQGPAQGGKAGDSELSGRNLSKKHAHFKKMVKVFFTAMTKTVPQVHFSA
jgi:hypothetical protein